MQRNPSQPQVTDSEIETNLTNLQSPLKSKRIASFSSLKTKSRNDEVSRTIRKYVSFNPESIDYLNGKGEEEDPPIDEEALASAWNA